MGARVAGGAGSEAVAESQRAMEEVEEAVAELEEVTRAVGIAGGREGGWDGGFRHARRDSASSNSNSTAQSTQGSALGSLPEDPGDGEEDRASHSSSMVKESFATPCDMTGVSAGLVVLPALAKGKWSVSLADLQALEGYERLLGEMEDIVTEVEIASFATQDGLAEVSC